MMEHLQPEITSHSASQRTTRTAAAAARRGGFTLVEIMVALAVFAIMMSIIFVPLNLALKLFHISKTRSDVLSAAQTTMDAIEHDLRRAIYVFPNEAMPGVTDRAPFTVGGANPAGRPYIRVATSGSYGVCDTDTTNAEYADNPSRIDFLLPDNFDTNTGANGTEQLQPLSPLRPAPYLVTYYARRFDSSAGASIADPFENPILLFRAQMPYREHNGAAVQNPPASGSINVNLASTASATTYPRYPDPVASAACTGATAATATNRASYWLNQAKGTNEPNLEPLCIESAGAGVFPSVPGSHVIVLPKGISLTAPLAYTPLPNGNANTNPDFTPDTSFHGEDTDGDHKIDQVTITLVLSSYDDIGADRRGAQLKAQRQALTHVISLPNVK